MVILSFIAPTYVYDSPQDAPPEPSTDNQHYQTPHQTTGTGDGSSPPTQNNEVTIGLTYPIFFLSFFNS
jgi:hypothetical protein